MNCRLSHFTLHVVSYRLSEISPPPDSHFGSVSCTLIVRCKNVTGLFVALNQTVAGMRVNLTSTEPDMSDTNWSKMIADHAENCQFQVSRVESLRM